MMDLSSDNLPLLRWVWAKKSGIRAREGYFGPGVKYVEVSDRIGDQEDNISDVEREIAARSL